MSEKSAECFFATLRLQYSRNFFQCRISNPAFAHKVILLRYSSDWAPAEPSVIRHPSSIMQLFVLAIFCSIAALTRAQIIGERFKETTVLALGYVNILPSYMVSHSGKAGRVIAPTAPKQLFWAKLSIVLLDVRIKGLASTCGENSTWKTQAVYLDQEAFSIKAIKWALGPR